MKVNDHAPVLLSVYNRVNHFSNCLTSLAKCSGAENTIVYISSDAAACEEDKPKVAEIRKIIEKFKGFKEIIPVYSEKNTRREIINKAYRIIFSKHDRLIRSEDDNVFAPNFLEYMNQGLALFEENPMVSAVCAYKFPFELPEAYPYNFFYSKGFSAWGFGIWRDKYTVHQKDENAIREVKCYLRNPLKALQLNSYQYGLLWGLVSIVETGKVTTDRMFCFHNLIKGTYCVFPAVSKVRNTGHDGSGVNCNKININPFIAQQIDTETIFKFSNLHYEYENKIVGDVFKKHNIDLFRRLNSLNSLMDIKLFIKYLIFIITH